MSTSQLGLLEKANYSEELQWFRGHLATWQEASFGDRVVFSFR